MKKKLFWIQEIIVNTVLLCIVLTKTVWGYIDPSAVTYVIQAVAAVVIAIGACLTIFRHKIISFFKKGKETQKKEIHFKDEETGEK